MKRSVGPILIAAAIACRIASAQPSCEATFKTSGSVLKGKTYSVQSDLSGVTVKDALNRLSAKLPSNEIEVVAVDPERGLLIGKTTTSGQRQYPVEFKITSTPEGCRVNLTLSLPVGAFAQGGMAESLCQIIAIAQSGSNGSETVQRVAENAPTPAIPETDKADSGSPRSEDPATVRHVAPEHLQNSTAANRIVSTTSGAVFLASKNTLFRMQRDEADLWDRVAEDIKSVAIDPHNDKLIYAINTADSVIKSLDGGQRWLTINSGLPQGGKYLIFINPTSTDEILVGTQQGLYRTKDGGFGWEATSLKLPITYLFVNPLSPSHAYALTSSGVVMSSSDSGTTWLKCEKGLPTELIRGSGRTAEKTTLKVANLFFVPHGGAYLLAATAGKGLFRSDDHGATWKQTGTGISPSARFSSAYIGDGEVILAGTEIVRSTDGNAWSSVPVKTFRIAPGSYDGVARHPRRDGLLVLFRYTNDSGNTQRIGYVGRGGSLVGLSYGVMPRSQILAAWSGSVAGKPALYATVSNWTPTRHEGRYDTETGTYVSVDDGYSWEYLLSTNCGARLAFRPGSPRETWLFGGSSCMSKTTTDGLGMAKIQGPRFQALNDAVNKIAFDPVDRNLLYYAAGVNEHEVYRFKYDADGNGEAVGLKVPAADIIVCEGNPKTLYAGVGHLSTDGGWTWEDKSAPLMKFIAPNTARAYRRHDFTLLACRGNEMRLAVHRYDSYMHSGGFWILGSKNLGNGWEIVSSFPDQQMTSVSVDPNDSTHLFAVVQRYAKTRRGTTGDAVEVIESRDWGATWKTVFSRKLPPEDENRKGDFVTSVTDTGDKRSLLIGGRVGLWKSVDGGQSWTQLGGAR